MCVWIRWKSVAATQIWNAALHEQWEAVMRGCHCHLRVRAHCTHAGCRLASALLWGPYQRGRFFSRAQHCPNSTSFPENKLDSAGVFPFSTQCWRPFPCSGVGRAAESREGIHTSQANLNHLLLWEIPSMEWWQRVVFIDFCGGEGRDAGRWFLPSFKLFQGVVFILC